MSTSENTPGMRLTVLAVSFTRTVAAAAQAGLADTLERILHLLPAIYGACLDLDPYGTGSTGITDDYDTGAIAATVDEEQYDDARRVLAGLLGENDVYLDTAVEDMRYSDTPVAVSLAEQLADIFQAMADFASTMAQLPADTAGVLADMKFRFHTYLSTTICSALKAANAVYINTDPEEKEEE